MSKLALLSMDVEDWYHLEYFERPEAVEWSMLDGVDRFGDFLAAAGVPATFFCLGDLAREMAPRLSDLRKMGHEMASHGPDHRLPSRQADREFREDLRRHKADLEDALGVGISGYRAPCFAMDRPKLDILAEVGFAYDSSFVDFPTHPLYGRMDLSGWNVVRPGVRRAPSHGLLEFEVPVTTVLGRTVPVAGGAYFRFFPWALQEWLLARALDRIDVYVFYIHPFECSARAVGQVPVGTGLRTRVRFSLGRHRVLPRLERLVKMLRQRGFRFATFSQAIAEL